MAKHYLDFVGLNTFIYEPVDYETELLAEKDRPLPEGVGTGIGIIAPMKIVQGDRLGFGVQNQIGLRSVSGFWAGWESIGGGAGSLIFYKNVLFSHQLSTTASYFPALMLKRNGPYGWPGVKAIRIGENPLTRRHRKENKITVMGASLGKTGSFVVTSDGVTRYRRPVPARYGITRHFDEPAVISEVPNATFNVGKKTYVRNTNRFGNNREPGRPARGPLTFPKFLSIKTSYNNETEGFCSQDLNNLVSYTPALRSDKYASISGMYLNGRLEDKRSSIQIFRSFVYHDNVYPPQKYTFKSYTRGRQKFLVNWRNKREDRHITDQSGFFLFHGL